MPLNQPHHFLKWSVLTLCLFCGVCTHHIQAQDPVYWQITDEEGLPSMTVYQIIQDTIGYIWMGTSNGLVKFDGKQFETYKHPDQTDNEIVTIRKDKFGRIWYSDLSNQLFYIENDSTYYFWANDLMAPYQITAYTLFEDEIILLISKASNTDTTFIHKIPIDQKIQQGPLSPNKFIPAPSTNYPIFVDNKDQIIYNYGPGLSTIGVLKNKKNQPAKAVFSKYLKESYDTFNEKTLKFFNLENYYITFLNNNLLISGPDIHKSLRFSFPQKIITIYIYNDEFWLLTNAGFYTISKDNLTLNKKPFFEDLSFNTMMEDMEGNIWMGTSANGLIIIPSVHVKNIQLIKNNLPTYSLHYNPESGQIFAGHDKGQVSIIDCQSQTLSHSFSTPNVAGRVVHFLKKDRLFICTDNNLIYKRNVYSENYRTILRAGAVKSVLIDRSDNLWIASNGATSKISLDSLTFTRDFLLDPGYFVLRKRTYAILEDLKGNMWLGTSTGLFTLKNQKVTPFIAQEKHIDYSIKDIVQLPDSSIYVATTENGLLKIKNNSVEKQYSTDNFLKSNHCNALYLDADNDLWIATSKGLTLLVTDEEKFYDFNQYDGLPSDEILSVVVVNDTVWAGTPKGLVTFCKKINTQNNSAPPVFFTGFSIHDKDTTMYEQYQLKYHQNNLQFDFLGLGFRARGNIKYQYQMLGIDTLWTETEARFARFPALNPGTYTFNVMAINEDGTKSASPASIKIFIAPPWWATWWFRISAITGLVGLVWLLLHLRYKNIRKREIMQQQFDKKVNELSMLALQTQMNPHFIFNSLNAIQQFLTTNDRESAMNYLSKFARLIRMVFEQSGKKKISLEEELEFLKIYLALESLRFNNEVEIELKISDEIEQRMDDYFVLPLLIQPVIENAFKHGLFHKKDEKKLSILFKKAGNYLKCTIIDNGVGRAKTEEINQWKSGNHKSSGLKTTKERLDIFHQNHPEFKHEPYFKITDLHHQGQPLGTKVEVVI